MLYSCAVSQDALVVQGQDWHLVDSWLPHHKRSPFPLRGRGLSFLSSNFIQAQLKAQEEERQKKDAEEKEAQLERKREEKRLKKMVSGVSCL